MKKAGFILTIVTILTVSILLILGLTLNATADDTAYSGKCGENVTWSLDPDTGELIISGNGAMAEYSYENWFSYRNIITKVTVEDGVTGICDYAFSECSDLTSATIGDSVTDIGNDTFAFCPNLESVTIGKGIKSIGGGVFSQCYSLTGIYISDIVAWCNIDFDPTNGNSYKNPLYNGADLYLNGVLVTDLVIPEGVTEIKKAAFQGYKSLVSITIPNSVTRIGRSAFEKCPNLKNITVGNGVTVIDEYAFSQCQALEQINIPNSVTVLGASAFEWCSSLKSVTISSNIEKICVNTFRGCSSLVSIDIPDSVKTIASGAFSGCVLKDVYFGKGISTIEREAFNTNIANVYVYDVEAWLNCSFYNYFTSIPNYYAELHFIDAQGNEITEIVIPEGVTEIRMYAFKNAKSVVSVKMGDSVTSIGEYAFCDCVDLQSVIFSKSLASIKQSAFFQCVKLDGIVLPASLKEIDTLAFCACSSLTGISIPGSVTSIGASSFSDCISLKIAILNEGVESIYGSAFHNCIKLETIILPSTITGIGERTFNYCSSLNKVIFCGTPEQWNAIDGTPYHTPEYHTHSWQYTDEERHEIACSSCTQKIYDEHKWAESGNVTQPTHTAEGFTEYSCSVCGATKKQAIEKLSGHTYGEWQQHSDTQHKKLCECGDAQYADHEFGEWTNSADTKREKVCICGYKVTDGDTADGKLPSDKLQTSDTQKQEQTADPTDNGKGCGSAISPYWLCLIISAAAACALCKKREDQN